MPFSLPLFQAPGTQAQTLRLRMRDDLAVADQSDRGRDSGTQEPLSDEPTFSAQRGGIREFLTGGASGGPGMSLGDYLRGSSPHGGGGGGGGGLRDVLLAAELSQQPAFDLGDIDSQPVEPEPDPQPRYFNWR